MSTLRTVAWINVGLHVAGLVFAAAAMRPGTPAAPLLDRIRYLSARPLGWSVGWILWIACAVALVAFMMRLARAVPSSLSTAAATLAVLGAVIDVTCDVAYIVWLPAKAAGDVAGFLDFEKHLGAASLTGANGLYSISVLVATLGLPATATLSRGLGVMTLVSGLVLAGAGLTGDPYQVMAGTALTIPFFLAWSLAASSSPRPR
jgi:hypothetical protein